MTSRIGRLPSRILVQWAYFLQASTPCVESGPPCPTLGLLLPPKPRLVILDQVGELAGAERAGREWGHLPFGSVCAEDLRARRPCPRGKVGSS